MVFMQIQIKYLSGKIKLSVTKPSLSLTHSFIHFPFIFFLWFHLLFIYLLLNNSRPLQFFSFYFSLSCKKIFYTPSNLFHAFINILSSRQKVFHSLLLVMTSQLKKIMTSPKFFDRIRPRRRRRRCKFSHLEFGNLSTREYSLRKI